MKRPSGKSRKPSWRKPKFRRGSGSVNGKVHTLTISYVGHRGEGVTWINQIETPDGEKSRCYIPYTVTGDTIKARITGERGEIAEIIEAGPDRVEPFCPHFGSCGGCALQHLDAPAYTAWKQNIVEEALDRQAIKTTVAPIIDAHGDGRRRVTVHVKISKQGIHAGFLRAKSHDLLNIDTCPVLSPALSECFQTACKLGAALRNTCNALDVQFATTSSGLDCNIIGPQDLTYDQHMDLADLAHEHNFARLSVNGDVVLEQRPPSIKMGAAEVTVSSGTFLQATELGEDTLSSLVSAWVGEAQTVADLFCGVGPFALRLAARASVYTADNNEKTIAALQHAVNHTPGLKPLEIVRRDLFADPLTMLELNRFDAVVFDPPRAGAQKQARELAQSSVPVVVAVSCDAASFARDARTLIGGGYTLREVVPVDQFKWSAHVEIAGYFVRI